MCVRSAAERPGWRSATSPCMPSATSGVSAGSGFRSSPAQKARPSPRRTIARTLVSNRRRSAIAHRSLVGPHAQAFSFSGRLNEMTPTCPSRVRMTEGFAMSGSYEATWPCSVAGVVGSTRWRSARWGSMCSAPSSTGVPASLARWPRSSLSSDGTTLRRRSSRVPGGRGTTRRWRRFAAGAGPSSSSTSSTARPSRRRSGSSASIRWHWVTNGWPG